jgi:hypothetical protein
MMFWRRAAERSPTCWHARWPRRWVSLAAQLLIVTILTLALAQPFLSSDQRPPQRFALVIDESASMWATDEPPTRFCAAIRAAGRLIDSLQPGDSLAILAAAERPRIVQPLTEDRSALRQALEGLRGAARPAAGVSDPRAAVALARSMLADSMGTHKGADGGHVVLLSDGCFEGADRLAATPDVELVRAGKSASNLAITACGARRDADDPARCLLMVEVTSFSANAAQTDLVMDLGGQTIELDKPRLAPQGVWRKSIPICAADIGSRDGAAIIRLTATDALSADNRASIVLPLCDIRTVVLVTAGNPVLRAALETQPSMKLRVVGRLPDESISDLPADTILVFDGVTPARLPAYPSLVIGPVNSCDLWSIAGKLEDSLAAWQDRGSPLLRAVRLDQARLEGVRRLTFSAPAHVLAATQKGDPLYAALERPEGRVLVLAAGTDLGDLPRHTAFPILIHNALAWLSAGPATVIRPRVETASGLLDRRESDLRPSHEMQTSSPMRSPFAASPRSSTGKPISITLLACGLGCVIGEWWLYQRRGVR